MTTLGDLVERTLGLLNQYTVNKPQRCTFAGWVGSSPYTGISLTDVQQPIAGGANLELETGELVYVSSYDTTSQAATVPPWFRGQLGTPKIDAVTTNSMVTIDPLWPRWHVAQKVLEGVGAIYPKVFKEQELTLTSSVVNGNYEVASTVDDVLRVRIEDFGPSKTQLRIGSWRLDKTNPDGKVYLRMWPTFPGRTIYVTYRARPAQPDLSAAGLLSTNWSTFNLPDSAQDIPCLFAASRLITSVDAAKLQMQSMEQGDQNRLIQGGFANSTSRRFEEMFQTRLREEQFKLTSPVRHKDV